MDSEELVRRPQEQIQPESVLIPVVAGGLTGLAVWLLIKIIDREKIKRADPPPIFIKSGSFVIESEDELDESTGGSPFHYRQNGFGQIKNVRVFKYNEILGISYVPINHPVGTTGIVVQVWLDWLVSGQWVRAANPEIIVSNTGNDFDLELKFAKKLDKRGKKHKFRQAKYEDKEDNIFRFGKIQVTGYTEIRTTNEGDEYNIGFHRMI
ncbi:MAG TPA: hypothetical protein VIL74_23910 [Pyrinomonadaceae bacterium]|jgi:hypothetical protein